LRDARPKTRISCDDRKALQIDGRQLPQAIAREKRGIEILAMVA
jgi:hypothetical protein